MADSLPEYPKFKTKARLVIISIDEIDNAHSGRSLAQYIERDTARVYQTFNSSGDYDAHIYEKQNITAERLKEILRDEAQHDRLRNCEGFICMLMTKCTGRMVITAGGKMDIDKVFEPFKEPGPSNGKPKLFFFYTTGAQRMSYVEAEEADDVETDAAVEAPAVRVPAEADFLIMHCNVPGFGSFISKNTGCSYFIDALCDAIDRHSEKMELLHLLMKVTNSLAIGDHKPRGNNLMVPQIVSTLTKRFYLS